MKNVAINGFGRIGRLTFKSLMKSSNKVKVVAINDLTDTATLAHLLKYDSAQGQLDAAVSFDEKHLIINGTKIPVFSEKEAKNLPWKSLEVDVVAECTGFYRTKERLNQHIEAGAKKVVVSAPAGQDVKTVVLGVNDAVLNESDVIVSNASCTTNCLAPMAKILNDNFGIESGYINTIHAYTADQNLQDAPHKDLRRARAAAQSIVPTTTGAAKAVGWVIPDLKGKLDGVATRVPVITGSITDFTVLLKKETDVDTINQLFKAAANDKMKGVLEYNEDLLVSSDIIGNPHSAIFQPDMTAVNGRLVKVVAWYDNEFGYASRMVDLLLVI